MVEYAVRLDIVFKALADSTRRDILRRVARQELSVNQIAGTYNMSLAAISKHLKVLSDAELITKRRKGKQHLIHAAPTALKDATEYLRYYEALLHERLESLEQGIKAETSGSK